MSFNRDSKGRIAEAIDPAGKSILYTYSAAGDLISVTDRENNVTQFTYLASKAHYLDSVIDPLGRTGVRAEYGSDGRLSALVDGNGGRKSISYDAGNQLVTTTDSLGRISFLEYDNLANVGHTRSSLRQSTEMTYK